MKSYELVVTRPINMFEIEKIREYCESDVSSSIDCSLKIYK